MLLPISPFSVPFVPAHGALGYWDELIFISVVIIFLVMMGVTWFRSRSMDFRDDDLLATAVSPASETPQDAQKPASETYFELD